MWRDNRNYLLRLRICVLGRNETVVLRHAEGSSCSWTSSAFWLWHWNPEQRRRGKCWNRSVSRGNAGAAWKTIGILCKSTLPSPFFRVRATTTYFFLRFPLALSSGPQFRNTSTSWLKASLKRKHLLYVTPAAIIYDFCSLFNQILSHASPIAKLSEQQIERIKSWGFGKIITWSPQQFILNHPVLYFCFYLSWLNT